MTGKTRNCVEKQIICNMAIDYSQLQQLRVMTSGCGLNSGNNKTDI